MAFRDHENKLTGRYFERFSIENVENQPRLLRAKKTGACAEAP